MASERGAALGHGEGVVAKSVCDGASTCKGGRPQGRSQDAVDMDEWPVCLASSVLTIVVVKCIKHPSCLPCLTVHAYLLDTFGGAHGGF